jgi:hypothetical protein
MKTLAPPSAHAIASGLNVSTFSRLRQRLVILLLLTAVIASLVACGGQSATSPNHSAGNGGQSGGTPLQPPPPPTAANVTPIVVNEGLNFGGGPGNPVRAFVSVTVCVPGTATCQTIDNIALDTGSTGLRIFNSLLNVPLPPQSLSAGAITEECALFGTSASSAGLWGTINTADVKISGETAKSVPIQHDRGHVKWNL